MKVKIDYDKCCWKNNKCDCECKCGSNSKISKECKGCVEVCPVNAITRNEKIFINQKKCIACGSCIEACPNKALSLI